MAAVLRPNIYVPRPGYDDVWQWEQPFNLSLLGKFTPVAKPDWQARKRYNDDPPVWQWQKPYNLILTGKYKPVARPSFILEQGLVDTTDISGVWQWKKP